MLRRWLLGMLHWLTGHSMGLLRLLRTRLRRLRPGLLNLAWLRLLRLLLRLLCLLPWLLGLRGALLWRGLLSALLWRGLLSALLWSRLLSALLRLLRVLLRLFLFLFGATFVLSVNGQQGPEKQKDCGRTRCADDFHVD